MTPPENALPPGLFDDVVRTAVLAPSVHNTQPWRFAPGPRGLEVRADLSRLLPHQDPRGRELYLSCGAAAQHALVAVRGAGRDASLALLPDPDDPELVATVAVGAAVPPDERDVALLAAAPLRHTDRSPFEDRAVPAGLLAALREAVEQEGCWLADVHTRDALVEVAVLVAKADEVLRDDPRARADLAAWVRDGGSPADGMPADALPAHGSGRGSPVTLRDFDPATAPQPRTAADDGPPAAERPLLVVLGTDGDAPADWARAGAALSRLLLTATSEGLVANPQTAVLEVPGLRARLAGALGLTGSPQMLLRIGWPQGPGSPRTRRRPLHEVVPEPPDGSAAAVAPGAGELRTGGPETGLATAETHLSWLVMVGNRVFKAKKPVRTAFLDLTSREARERVAEREVRLNRRLAPDVYLGVARLAGLAGLDEPVVVMRRMPGSRRLATLAASGAPLDDEVRAVAAVLARFHGQALPAAASGTAEAVARQWNANTVQLRADPAVDRGNVDRLAALAGSYLAGRGPLLSQRLADGRLRDGHGDLLADDVFCLDDGPRVLDCLEFDDALRGGDVLADVAFLAMDLTRLGRPELGDLLLREHRRLLQDDWPASLADHWVAYRAQVRAKVAGLRAAQGDPDGAASARAHLQLALDRIERAQVRIVLVGGTPGTGKSTLAAALGARTGWPVLRSDVARKLLGGRGLLERGGDGIDTGLYDPRTSAEVLAELLRQTAELTGRGLSVILDAAWSTELWRERVAATAERTSCRLLPLHVVAPDAVADDRLRRRAAHGSDPSDATVETARVLRTRFAPWPAARRVDADRPFAMAVDELVPVLTGAGPAVPGPRAAEPTGPVPARA